MNFFLDHRSRSGIRREGDGIDNDDDEESSSLRERATTSSHNYESIVATSSHHYHQQPQKPVSRHSTTGSGRSIPELPKTTTSYPQWKRKWWYLFVIVTCFVSLWAWYLFQQETDNRNNPTNVVRTEKASVLAAATIPSIGSNQDDSHDERVDHPQVFPDDFVWGAATSSFQIEVSSETRGWTIWDEFCRSDNNNILDGSNGSVACDHYHHMPEDVVKIMKEGLHLRAYRFSIAWSRILPNGNPNEPINQEGLNFYIRLVDLLLANDIEPWVTLFHWDLPQALQEQHGGWLHRSTIDAFEAYSRICFEALGDKVRHWITINEAWTVAVNGYATGVHAPGHVSGTEPYMVAHHLLLAHARVAQVFHQEYNPNFDGRIGMANCGDYRYPLNPAAAADIQAAQRAMEFQYAWLVDPLLLGDYPVSMRQRLGDRLPQFTPEEQDLLRNHQTDFWGLNYYSSLLATTTMKTTDESEYYTPYWSDMEVEFSGRSEWKRNDMGWYVVPDGLERMLHWISHRYQNHSGRPPLIYITENGTAEPELNNSTIVDDRRRQEYLESHIHACGQAMQSGKVRLGGYFAWSLMDNFEWQFGYQRRFGLYHVDFDTQLRSPKTSALWYRQVIDSNGAIVYQRRGQTDRRRRQLSVTRVARPRPTLPDKVLLGYGSEIDLVRRGVYNGVNVVAWSFLSVNRDQPGSPARIHTNLNLTAVRELVQELDDDGFDHVVHLVSTGGWNGGHLDDGVSAEEWWAIFATQVGDIFDGIDWDLEGNDIMTHPSNFFTRDCLTKMGEISRLAKQGKKRNLRTICVEL